MLAMAVPAPTLDEGAGPVRRVEGSEGELVLRAHRVAWLVVHDAAAAASGRGRSPG